ncbi:MAG TPA: hypothetical protein VMV94_09465 [Phycisphaerae bacterium]|nr:hypothetical protein [Phycisphaerae bacterium]
MLKPPKQKPRPKAFIAEDVPCQHCAYNLRTLPEDGRCPECGEPVRFSLLRERLRFVDPVWLGKLKTGAKVPLYAPLGGLLLSLAGHAVLGLSDYFVSLSNLNWLIGMTSVLSIAGGCAVVLYGVWLVATPNEMLLARETWKSPRRVLRACVLVAALGLGTIVVVFVFPPAWWALALVAVTISPVGVVSVAGVWALCRYVQELAERLPDDLTERKAREYRTNYVICWLLSAGPGAVGFVAWGGPMWLFTSAPALTGVVVLEVACLFLPDHLVKGIQSQLNRARQPENEGA